MFQERHRERLIDLAAFHLWLLGSHCAHTSLPKLFRPWIWYSVTTTLRIWRPSHCWDRPARLLVHPVPEYHMCPWLCTSDDAITCYQRIRYRYNDRRALAMVVYDRGGITGTATPPILCSSFLERISLDMQSQLTSSQHSILIRYSRSHFSTLPILWIVNGHVSTRMWWSICYSQ